MHWLLAEVVCIKLFSAWTSAGMVPKAEKAPRLELCLFGRRPSSNRIVHSEIPSIPNAMTSTYWFDCLPRLMRWPVPALHFQDEIDEYKVTTQSRGYNWAKRYGSLKSPWAVTTPCGAKYMVNMNSTPQRLLSRGALHQELG